MLGFRVSIKGVGFRVFFTRVYVMYIVYGLIKKKEFGVKYLNDVSNIPHL